MTLRLCLKRALCRLVGHRRVRTLALDPRPAPNAVTVHCGRCGTFLGWDTLRLGDF